VRLLPGHGCDPREIGLRTAANIALSVSLALAAAALPSVANAAELNLSPNWSVVVADVIVFGLLIYPVNRLLIQPLLHVVEAREKGTAGSLEEAGRLEGDSRSLGAELEARLAEARVRANASRAATLAAAEQQERALMTAASGDAARTIETVRASIASDLAEARSALERDASSLAREAAARLLGRPIG
jgi:F0F1-type ATP synthase membrane subunit b/b'